MAAYCAVLLLQCATEKMRGRRSVLQGIDFAYL